MKLVYLTAGAAGMYCGSCMLDNAVARAMIKQGHEALLVPLYTPIRTDEDDVSLDRVFFGGINVYLQQYLPWLSYLPRWSDAFLNQSWLIRRLTKNVGKTSADFLGRLALSMLQGMHGNQRKEVIRLADWIENAIRPDALLLTNLLIGGCVPELKRRIAVPIFVILQGDDIFLDALLEKHRQPVIQSMRDLVPLIDGFIVHSHDYGQRMAELLGIPESSWHVVPLGIELDPAPQRPATSSEEGLLHPEDQPPLSGPLNASSLKLGYFARMAPEKGLHQLVDAFIDLAKLPENADIRLEMAGWMGPQHLAFWEAQRSKLESAGLAQRYRYHGSLDRHQKRDFYRDIDLLSVPTTYLEPKGLFVLEAAAAGVPYVQPAHGAFPELHARIQGGWLYEGDSPSAYREALQSAIRIIRQRKEDGKEKSPFAQALDRDELGIDRMARRILERLSASSQPRSPSPSPPASTSRSSREA